MLVNSTLSLFNREFVTFSSAHQAEVNEGPYSSNNGINNKTIIVEAIAINNNVQSKVSLKPSNKFKREFLRFRLMNQIQTKNTDYVIVVNTICVICWVVLMMDTTLSLMMIQ